MSAETDSFLRDYVLTNLKTLSKLDMNKKIIVRNGVIILDDYPFPVQWAKRWLMGDNRSETVQFIKTVFHNAFQMYQNHITIHKSSKDKGILTEINHIKTSLSEALTGVNNLSKTYHNDAFTKSTIEVLVELTHVHIENMRVYVECENENLSEPPYEDFENQ